MKIIKQSVELVEKIPFKEEQVIELIEYMARICYESDCSNTIEGKKKFLKARFKGKHFSIFEHFSITGYFNTCVGVGRELRTHRILSCLERSTRYCNFSKNKFGSQITSILPIWFYEIKEDDEQLNKLFEIWRDSTQYSAERYFDILKTGGPPQLAREVLPFSLETKLFVTANIREWWHILNLRRAKAAHPQMIDLMEQWWAVLSKKLPFFFGEIQE